MTIRALLRVSTDKQAKAGTIASQRGPVRALAHRVAPGAPVVEYVEEAVSGAAALADRDVLARLLADLAPGDVVCIYALDRLTRATRLSDRLAPLDDIRERGARLYTVEDGEIDTGSIGGEIVAQIRGSVAAEERRKIKARTAAGRARVLAAGGKPYARTPYGLTYDVKAKRWSIDETEAAVLREMRDLRLGGASWNAIGAEMARRGIMRKRSTAWPAEAVYRLVMSPTYRGRWLANGVEVPVPAIFSDLDGARLDALCNEAKRACRKGRSKAVLLLDGGVAVCGACGAPVYVHNAPTRGGAPLRYYVCRARLRPARGADRCPAPYLRVEAIDEAVWQAVVDAVATDGELEGTQARRRAASTARADLEAAEREIATATRLLGEADAREATLVEMFGRGRVTAQAMEAGMEAIDRMREARRRDLATARAEAAQARRLLDATASAPRSLADWRARVEGATEAGRRVIVAALCRSVVLDGNRVRFVIRPDAAPYVSCPAESSNSREPDTAAVPVRIQLDRR